MDDLFRQFWWLMFPLFWFVFGGFSLWMRYRRQQAWLELMKTYAAQGKDPPEGLSRGLRGEMDDGDGWRPMGPWGWRGRRGPYYEWRRVILFTGLAAGFFIASHITESHRAAESFEVVAVIMTVLAFAFGAMAILSAYVARPFDPDER